MKLGLVVGNKGRGSNMANLAAQFAVHVVLANDEQSPALARAKELGLPTKAVPSSEMLGALSGCDVVCLCGYLRLLPVDVLEAFPGRVLNIHPALLPKFGGKGMYGRHVHEAVIAAGEQESGCSVHQVTPVYDEGKVLVQLRCPVLPGDSPETLAARVLQLEFQAYPMAVRMFA